MLMTTLNDTNKASNRPTAAITAIPKGSLLQEVPEGTGGYGDGYGTAYRVCFLGTTDRGELYLLPYIDLNTGGSLRFFK